MQQSGDKTKRCLGLDHPGQNKEERPKHKESVIWRRKTRRPGLDHAGRDTQQEPPTPGLDPPGTRGGMAPRTGSSGAGDQTRKCRARQAVQRQAR